MIIKQLLACPFCGNHLDANDPDTVHPSGTGWKEEEDGFRHYVNFREVPREQWCYYVICPAHYGGCDAEVCGDSEDEAIAKWNTRVKRD